MAENRPRAARVFEESQEAIDAAQVTRERARQVRLQAVVENLRLAPRPVDPDTAATLRRMLCRPERARVRTT